MRHRRRRTLPPIRIPRPRGSRCRTRSRRGSICRAPGRASRRPSRSIRRTRSPSRGSPSSTRRSATSTQTLAAAQKAATLDPNLARTQTVLGFAYLVAGQDRRGARGVREGDRAGPGGSAAAGSVSACRRSATAVSTKARATSRSRRASTPATRSCAAISARPTTRRSSRRATSANTRSRRSSIPKDPTPFFYDAIAKQTTNRPVEALQDMETAIALNDNRAVYRSELLLDSDNASRSASLARVYTDLGFQQLALVEGYKAVNADPTNFSAHRFLSDTYSVLPRHEIGRVSELLQSQLLQPINMTPIQPRAGESSLFLISSGGPGTASFNEFNPLFTSDGYTLQLNGMGGREQHLRRRRHHRRHRRQGCVQRRLLGLQDRRLPGQRRPEGPDLHRLRPVRLHAADEHAGRVPAPEASSGETLRSRSSRTSSFPDERSKMETDTVRVGFRHAFSPESIVLASVIYQNTRARPIDNQLEPSRSFRSEISSPAKIRERRSCSTCIRSPQFNVTTGVGYFDVDRTSGHDVQSHLSAARRPRSDIQSQERRARTSAHQPLRLRLLSSPSRT